jgi:hypothetical protein
MSDGRFHARPDRLRLKSRATPVKGDDPISAKHRRELVSPRRDPGNLRVEINKSALTPRLERTPGLRDVGFKPPTSKASAFQSRRDWKTVRWKSPVEYDWPPELHKSSGKGLALHLSPAGLPRRFQS